MTDEPPGADPFLSRWSRLEHLGDAEAAETWEWFVKGYEPFVRGLLRVRGCRSESAVDEFWSYLFARRDKLTAADRGRRFRPFLTGFIRNFVRETRRSSPETATDTELLDAMASRSVAALESVESRLWAETVLRRALDYVEAMRAHRGRVLRLFYGIGEREGETAAKLSVSEVAARLEMATSTISPLLTEARRMLRHAIERDLRETVLDEQDLTGEIGVLLESLRGPYPGLCT
jgi:RNA polymerase sigma factor (sigma-70 family)